MKKNAITLIGMPGVGKSTVGPLLAKSLGYTFLDTDELIEEAKGQSLQEVVDQLGQDAFRSLEEDTICALEKARIVIATGGSAVYSSRAMEHLSSLGSIVWLQLAYSEIEKRIALFPKRGLAIRPNQSWRDLYDERLPLYKRYATHRVDASGDVKAVVQAISSEFGL